MLVEVSSLICHWAVWPSPTLEGVSETLFTEEEAPRRSAGGRKVTIIVLAGAGALLLIAAAVAVLYLASLRGAYQDAVNVIPEDETFPEAEDRPERPTRTDEDGDEVEDEQLNILLIGSDSGGGSGESENVPWLPNAGRADTIMWMHIPHERDSVQVMSVMRDTWVPIPGHGEAKINASMSFGGSATTVATMEELMDVRIDHVAAVDMVGFQNLVGAMEGVTVDSPVSFTSRDGHHFHGGPQSMNSTEAMSFVRERKAFDDGDFQRAANQQALMRGVLDEVLTPSTLTNPARIHSMVSTFAPHMAVDSQLSDAEYVTDLGWSMREVRGGDIDMFTIDNHGLGTAGSESIIVPDYDAFSEAGEAMREGRFDEYAAEH